MEKGGRKEEEKKEAEKDALGKKRLTRSSGLIEPPLKKTRGRKPAPREELPKLFLSDYCTEKPPEVLLRVDRQTFFSSVSFKRKETADDTLAPDVTASVGQVVKLLPYNDFPFVIVAIHSTSKGIIYKMIGDPVVGGAVASKQTEIKQIDHALSDVTKVMTEKVVVDPMAYPSKKKENIKLRKQKQMRIKVRPPTCASSTHFPPRLSPRKVFQFAMKSWRSSAKLLLLCPSRQLRDLLSVQLLACVRTTLAHSSSRMAGLLSLQLEKIPR